MTYYLTHLKDAVGYNYIGVNIPESDVSKYLEQLKEILKDDFDRYISNKMERDNGDFHITVIPVSEYNALAKKMGYANFVKSLDLLFSYEIDDLEMLGLGEAESKNNKAYFVVCQSDKLDAVRVRFELKLHDFHITLGFDRKDVFGVRKNKII